MIPRSTALTGEGRRTRTALLWATGLVVGLNLVVFVIAPSVGGGVVSGPGGSSYVTTADGTAALAGTLERLGAEVVRGRQPTDELALTPAMTLAVLDVGMAPYPPQEVRALEDFLAGGGRVVVAGRTGLAGELWGWDDAPRWRTAGAGEAEFTVPSPIDVVLLSSFGSLEITEFNTGHRDEPLIVDPVTGTVVAAMRPVGDGVVVWVADSHPFLNRGIGRGDNAAAVVGLLGPGRTVVFDEYRHGHSDSGGLFQLLPARVRTALLLGAVVALIALIAYGRRFGPPHDTSRRLGPERSRYFEAMAGLLERADAVDDATGILRDEARWQLVRRGGEGSDLAQVAAAAGVEDKDITTLLRSGTSPDDLLGVDRALAALSKKE